jgi:hypothetical protein
MTLTRNDLINQYQANVREAWSALAAVVDHPEATGYEPWRDSLTSALKVLELEASCGDCVEGRCHWGGQKSRDSITAAEEGREYHQRCGCERHEFSVSIRRRDAGYPGTERRA